MTSRIHPTALVHPESYIADDVEIGPFCVVGPQVKIGEGTQLKSHVVIDQHVEIGKKNIFYPHSLIGASPQDFSYKNEPTRVIIGDNNTFREFISIHRGTTKQNGETRIGNNGYFMAYVHIGHDVVIEDRAVIINAVNIAGHVHIGEGAAIGGGSNIARFVSIGKGAYVGGASAVDRDILPFCTAYGNRVQLKGINIVGLRRRGIDRKIISEAVEFYKMLETSSLSPKTFVSRSENISEFKNNNIVSEIAQFIEKSELGVAPIIFT